MPSVHLSGLTRRLVACAHDVAALVLCWYAAYWIRFNLDVPPDYLRSALHSLPLLLVLHIPVYWLMGLYRGIWRYASVMDLRRIIMAVGMAAVFVAAAVQMLGVAAIPRSVLLLHPILLIVVMGGSRFIYRAWKDRMLYGHLALGGEPVLVLGAGDAAERLLRELAHSHDWRVVGLLDNAPRRVGTELRGVRILGPLDDLAVWAEKLEVRRAIVAMPEASAKDRRLAMELAVQSGLKVLTVPSMNDMLAGNVAVSQMRQVQLEDLLGREPVQLDAEGLRGLLGERVVLVTGAGGSIGSELARQIASFQPSLLVLFELSEFALYQIEQEFAATFPRLSIACVVGDVKDAARLDGVFATYKPAVVFHAAAYKHVPLMESGNAWEAVRNNVGGSRCLAEASIRYGVEKFVLISTDKAVNPTNVMGATKRLAERVLAGYGPGCGTRFITVRFGNVLGSNGSVIPKFREQIAKGGPVTVTHPDIIRYFMLIPEAAQLVLQAGLMGQGGEIFVLEMGEPIRIADLAKDMIRLSGFSDDEIKIVFTGLRPGEKLYEELLTDNEQTLATPHPKLRVGQAEVCPGSAWQAEVLDWVVGSPPSDVQLLKTRLQYFVPEYLPQM
ncbi:polysaccharide biosynthesis protein [Dechloromonas denitrificans]|uniref:polysaccharide biosynthesis protein n=1 Tax=Dechloromonas denitrificans TaxID=281362 RepID=UPI001CF92621|nr:nucleoside-diphosphate sugar epimerase/dehydratase [Dechloromonas denitrificans]UCV10561.1 polysaccharide biosynthesis protein [Dechloromonas denitrificans]